MTKLLKFSVLQITYTKKNDIQTEKVHINNNIKHDHRRETYIRQAWR